MALSPAHRFGQIIGEILEAAIFPLLQKIADQNGLFLDHKGPRPARGKNRKVTWKDSKGNTHDLDYVMEKGGSATHVGSPRAFVEVAWRRHTKHSRNKAQEIQGAIGPLAEKYAHSHPFLGAVLGGVFTQGSLTQLESHRFQIVYVPYESVIKAFAAIKLDARYDEDSPDREVQRKVDAYEALSPKKKEHIPEFLRKLHAREFAAFLDKLNLVLRRSLEYVFILPLHGSQHQLTSIDDAINFLVHYNEAQPGTPFVRYEIIVRYTNADEIKGQFGDKHLAIEFLRTLRIAPE